MSLPWAKPEVFNIKWDNGPNVAASPLEEISREEFLALFFCGPWGLDGLNYSGWAPLPDEPNTWYSWNYYFFHRYALAVAHRYDDQKPDSKCYVRKADDQRGYEIRFYRLRC